jgi:hypothetical protein
MKNRPLYAIAGSILLASPGNAQTVVYSENFDPAPDFLVDFNVQLGGDPGLLAVSTKIVSLGQWALTTNGSFVDIGGDNGNVLRPQQLTRENGRVAGVFLDPALFSATGAGTYTLVFDLIPSSEAGAGRVYVGSGSGYDLSGATDARLRLALAAPGFNVRKSDGELLWTALTGLDGAAATHHATTNVEWVLADGTATGDFFNTPGMTPDVLTAATLSVPFEYDGTSTVVIAFAGYDTDFGVDNIRIETAVPPGDTWAGYPIDSDGFVDTGDWMGLLYVGDPPWIWRYDISQWWYMPESLVSEGGAWAFILK